MHILITGVPSTGKTTLAEALAKELSYNYISEKSLLKKGMYEELMLEGSLVKDVDIAKFEKEVSKLEGDSVFDGFLFPETKIKYDLVVVLYETEEKLTERMKERGYSDVKIEDNLYSQKSNYLLKLVEKSSKNILIMERSEIKEDLALIKAWIEENPL